MKKLLSILNHPIWLYKLVIICLLISLSNSCSEKPQNDNQEAISEQAPDKYMQNGRLVFKTQDAYMNHLKWIHLNQTKPEVIRRFNSQIGLVSMKEIFDQGMELVDNQNEFLVFVDNYKNVFEKITDQENSVIYEIEAPPTFAYLANQDGVFQVGNTIYRLTYNFTIEIIDGDETKIPKIVSYDESIIDPSIKAKTTSIGKKGQLYYRTNYFSDTKRMVSRHWESIVMGLYTYRVETTGQSRVLGVWVQKKLNYIEASWTTGYYRTCYYGSFDGCWFPDYPINSGGASYEDKANVDIVFLLEDYPVLLDVSYCFATHRGQLESGGPFLVRQDDALEDL